MLERATPRVADIPHDAHPLAGSIFAQVVPAG